MKDNCKIIVEITITIKKDIDVKTVSSESTSLPKTIYFTKEGDKLVENWVMN